MHFKGLDLNLLVVLDALLEEQSVSRAAVRLNVSQPAVSAALAKLRWHTGDEILQKIGRTTRLTPRALAMMKPLKEILIQIETTVKGQSTIDPAAIERDFTISMTSYSAQILLPELMPKLLLAAPRVTCSVEDIAADTVTRVKSGELDLCVTFLQTKLLNPRENLDELSHAHLFSDKWVMVAGNDNRRISETVDSRDVLPVALCRHPAGRHRQPGGTSARSVDRAPSPGAQRAELRSRRRERDRFGLCRYRPVVHDRPAIAPLRSRAGATGRSSRNQGVSGLALAQ